LSSTFGEIAIVAFSQHSMENTPLLTRVKNPLTESSISAANTTRRHPVFARIITMIGVIGVLTGITILVSRSGQSGIDAAPIRNVASVQQGSAFGEKNHSTVV
jgi:hypothetical protein